MIRLAAAARTLASDLALLPRIIRTLIREARDERAWDRKSSERAAFRARQRVIDELVRTR